MIHIYLPIYYNNWIKKMTYNELKYNCGDEKIIKDNVFMSLRYYFLILDYIFLVFYGVC